ncbi:hypothetical protein [Flavobacterium sp.]|uniref:hypothetical protein n=1 Tax=Flavobacterium sp. TaxID=239 RepID=UPI003D098EF9
MKAEAGQSGNYYDWDEGIYKNKDTGKQVDADVAIASHSGSEGGTPPDDYVFNENGDYVRTDKNNKPDRLIVENSKTGARRSYGFADPKEDPKNIKNGFISKLEFVSVTQISDMIKQQGGFKAENGSWMAFYEKSKGGQNFDYTFSVLSSTYHNAANSLYLPKGGDGLAHNLMNFGNFLWTATGYSLGFDYSTLKMAAHANSLFNPGSNGYSPQLDSKDDQRSIFSGATYSAMYGFKFFVKK